jgi:site-specific recombinase XerD
MEQITLMEQATLTERGNQSTEDAGTIVLAGDDAREIAHLSSLTEQARQYIEDSKAKNTRRAYRSDWTDFTDWCQHHKRVSLPAHPETVALYLTDSAKGLKTSTLQRRLASISEAHKTAGHESPTQNVLVRSVWQGIRREKGVATTGKSPALTADIRTMIQHLPAGKLLSVRDRTLLLIGFAGAMRRSELVALNVADIVETEEGLVVTVQKSKTDQEGKGRKIGLPYGSDPLTCPVRALRQWLKESGIVEGALFRGVDRHGKVSKERLSDQMVARVVKRSLRATGKEAASFAGHSLRAGLATQAAMSGVSERAIQDQTGHKSLPILRRYIRDGSLFRENAAAKVGL